MGFLSTTCTIARQSSGWLIQRDPDTDWFAVIADLERMGVCNSEAAARINVPRETLRRWKEGSKPNFDDGKALLTLWLAVRKEAQLRRQFIFGVRITPAV